MSIYSASKVTSGTKRPRSSSKTYSKESSLTGRGILNDDRDDSDDDVAPPRECIRDSA